MLPPAGRSIPTLPLECLLVLDPGDDGARRFLDDQRGLRPRRPERAGRDLVLLRGASDEYWYAFVVGDPPAKRGRVFFGSVGCGK